MNPRKNCFEKIKNGNLAIDQLSLFLLTTALIHALLMTIFRLNQLVILAWIPILISYWRTYSKNRLQRFKENQVFIKYYDPIDTWIKNLSRCFDHPNSHVYFKCKSCRQPLRIPKKADHIKVTCPKCNHSFIRGSHQPKKETALAHRITKPIKCFK